MSCYNNRENYNYLASKTSSGNKYMSFTDTRTTPETVNFLIRNFLSDGANSVKRRAFQMFFMINQHTSGKPDTSATMLQEYPMIVRSLFIPFINAYGKYNNSLNYAKELNTIRINVVRYIKKIIGCGDVNLIFKSESATPLTDEISCYINDTEISNGKPMKYSINNLGLQLSDTATLTISISLKFIENTINTAFMACSEEFKKSGIKLESIDSRLNTAIINSITESVPKKLFKSFICAIYKEQIFNKFAQDVVLLSNIIQRMKVDSEEKIQIPYNFADTTPSLNLKILGEVLKQGGINELNPHILLDIFEISNNEVNTFIKNYIRDDSKYSMNSPKYSYLQLNTEDYVDNESRIAAGTVYISKLNYCIMALMMLTKGSIKEASRTKYCEMVRNSLNSVKVMSSVSMVTNNKDMLISEISSQLENMSFMANDIIKLKRFSEKVGVQLS